MGSQGSVAGGKLNEGTKIWGKNKMRRGRKNLIQMLINSDGKKMAEWKKKGATSDGGI